MPLGPQGHVRGRGEPGHGRERGGDSHTDYCPAGPGFLGVLTFFKGHL